MNEDKLTNPIENARKRIKKNTLANVLFEHGKLPPQAVDIEETVLGALMLEQDALTSVIDILKPEIFYKESHQKIFSAILRLFGRSEPIDILTVTSELKKSGELELIGGPYYISQLTGRVASAANIEYHTRIIIQKYIQRELIRISSDITREAYEDTTDVFDLLDYAERNMFAIGENNLRRNYDDIRTLITQAKKQIEIASQQEGHLSGVPSGFTDLDRVTAGWQKSDLVILASRPGMGKTAFVLSLARNMAVDFRHPVAVFSLEMSSIQLATRLIASEAELNAEKLRKGTLEEYEWQQLNSKISRITEAPIFIDDTPALSIFELRAKCRRLKAQHNIEMIIVDYLQLMTTGSENYGNREQEISNISRSLKSLAKELNVPVIVLSQLSRAVETRGGSKRPILSDLRESGAIEQDADLVLFIYRPEYYGINEDEAGTSTEGKAEIIIAKHRNGPLETINLRFVGKYAKFMDLDSSFDSGRETFSQDDHDKGTISYTLPSKLNDMDSEKDEAPY